MENIKAEIFNGPQIRQLMKDSHFASQMIQKESAAWTAFALVIKNFLGNYEVHSISFQTFFVQAFIIAVNSRYFSVLLLYSL